MTCTDVADLLDRFVDAGEAQARPFALGWQNWWVRCAASFAAVVLLGTLATSQTRLGNWVSRGHNAQEIESPLEDMNAITFHSESANLTVIWVQSEDADTN